MEENFSLQDDPISYFKSTIEEIDKQSFNSIFWDIPKQIKSSMFVLISIIIGIYFIFSLFITNVLLVPLSVEGASMYPTLNVEYSTTGNSYAQDVVYIWRTKNIQYKDIVVFDSNNYNSKKSKTPIYYIKRVIATAGDTIQFVKVHENTNTGLATYQVLKNGKLLEEDYLKDDMLYITNSSKASLVTSEEIITIPENYCFVMGDNRNNSKDSRELGLISLDDILGKMVLHIEYGETAIHGIIKSIQKDYLF